MDEKICPKCSAPLPEDAKHCPECGADLTPQEPVAAEPETAEAPMAPEPEVVPAPEPEPVPEPAEEPTKTCPRCASIIPEAAKHCPECGLPLGIPSGEPPRREEAPTQTFTPVRTQEPKQEPVTIPVEEPKKPGRKTKAARQSLTAEDVKGTAYQPVSSWGWVGYFILFSIPAVGLILSIIFAAGGHKKKNVVNFCRGMWLCILIALILCGIAVIVLWLVFGPDKIMDTIREWLAQLSALLK